MVNDSYSANRMREKQLVYNWEGGATGAERLLAADKEKGNTTLNKSKQTPGAGGA